MKIILSIDKLNIEAVTVVNSSDGQRTYFRFPDGQWELYLGDRLDGESEYIDKKTIEELEELYQRKRGSE